MASCRPWVPAGLLGGPSGSAALYSGDAAKLPSRCSSYTGVLMFLGMGMHARFRAREHWRVSYSWALPCNPLQG